MALTERGSYASTLIDERGKRVFGNQTERGLAVFGVINTQIVTGLSDGTSITAVTVYVTHFVSGSLSGVSNVSTVPTLIQLVSAILGVTSDISASIVQINNASQVIDGVSSVLNNRIYKIGVSGTIDSFGYIVGIPSRLMTDTLGLSYGESIVLGTGIIGVPVIMTIDINGEVNTNINLSGKKMLTVNMNGQRDYIINLNGVIYQ